MRQKIKYGLFFSLLGVMGILGCEDEAARKERRRMIIQAYEEKILIYRSTHEEKCRSTSLAEAKIIADSTMLANARNIKVVDSLGRPPKPIKPSAPIPKSLKDSILVAPLLPLNPQDSIIGE